MFIKPHLFHLGQGQEIDLVAAGGLWRCHKRSPQGCSWMQCLCQPGVGRQESCPGAVGSDCVLSGVEPSRARGAAGGCLEGDCFGRHWQKLLKAVYSLQKADRKADRGSAWLRIEYEGCCHDYRLTFPAWSKK